MLSCESQGGVNSKTMYKLQRTMHFIFMLFIFIKEGFGYFNVTCDMQYKNGWYHMHEVDWHGGIW